MDLNPKSYTILIFLTLFVSFSNCKLVLKPEEIKALEKFRPLVNNILTHDYQKHDSYLVRWLQARKLNVNDAVQMLTEAQKWRKKNKIDSILNEDFKEFSHFYNYFTDDGVDYEGRTVFTSSLGSWDFRKILISGNHDRLRRFTQYAIEKAVSKAAETVYRSNGTLTDSRLVGITDFQGFSLQKHACLACLSLFTEAARETENYYPGINGLAIYINTPRIALPVIETFSALLSEETRNSLHAFGTDRKEWTKYIRTVIPPDQITYQFGGTKKN